MGGINKIGRPKKFNDGELLKIVKDYIENEYEKNKPIKYNKLAKSLKSSGINIVYQDLKRYEDVEKYIEEYNLRFKTQLDVDNKEKNRNIGGRPRKFNEDELLIAVKGYVKSLGTAQSIKISKVAKHFQDKGIKLTYQDLKRYTKVYEFIQDYNEKYKEILFRGVIEDSTEKPIGIFKQIDVDDFLKHNKTQKDIEKALLILNQTNEKLVEYTEKLQNKIIFQNEKIINQSAEIDNLKFLLQNQEIEFNKNAKKYEQKIKKNKEKISKFNRIISIYDEFIDRYHYANLVEYALCLERNLHIDEMKKIDGFIDEEKYKNGDLNLKDIADKYYCFQLAVENAVNKYNEAEDKSCNPQLDEISLKEYINNFIINKKNEKENNSDTFKHSQNVIESMNLSIDDLNSTLSIIDDI